MSMWEPVERTPERQKLLDYAQKALHAHPGVKVVRFVIPEPLNFRAFEPSTAAAPEMQIPVCSITRTRFTLGYRSLEHRIPYRIHNARSGETFYVSDQGDLFVSVEDDDG